MTLSLAISGNAALAKRLAAAVTKLSDLELSDSSSADVHVDCGASPTAYRVTEEGVQRVSSRTSSAGRGPSVRAGGAVRRLPSPDACAVQRIIAAVHSLGALRRCFVRAITRTARATEMGVVDALLPTFDDIHTTDELQTLVNNADALNDRPEVARIEFAVRRVFAPYTHSHLLVLKLDFGDGVDRAAAVEALRIAPRILVGSGKHDGLPTTAHLQEYFRDQGRMGGERMELFVWEESVLTQENSLYLMADHSPDSVLVPEVIDAVWQVADGSAPACELGRETDRCLGLWRCLKGSPT